MENIYQKNNPHSDEALLKDKFTGSKFNWQVNRSFPRSYDVRVCQKDYKVQKSLDYSISEGPCFPLTVLMFLSLFNSASKDQPNILFCWHNISFSTRNLTVPAIYITSPNVSDIPCACAHCPLTLTYLQIHAKFYLSCASLCLCKKIS